MLRNAVRLGARTLEISSVVSRKAVGLTVMAFAVTACGQQPSAEPAGPRPTTAGKIVFTRGILPASIYVMSADGTGATQLTAGDDSRPGWSPDGKHIVFARTTRAPANSSGHFPPPSSQIWVMNADGTGQTKLTEPPGNDDYPAWSPTGDRVVFVRTAERQGFTEFPGKIYVMDAHGRNRAQVTSGDMADGSPTWSPNGKRIAFVRYPFHAGSPTTYGPGEVFVVNIDGSGLTKVGGKANDHPFTQALGWSADGTKIAVEASDQIYVMNADGTGQTRLTFGRSDGWPTWSPDGTAIAFESHRNSKDLYGFERDIYVINSNGTGVVRLTTSADSWSPAWWHPPSTAVNPGS